MIITFAGMLNEVLRRDLPTLLSPLLVSKIYHEGKYDQALQNSAKFQELITTAFRTPLFDRMCDRVSPVSGA